MSVFSKRDPPIKPDKKNGLQYTKKGRKQPEFPLARCVAKTRHPDQKTVCSAQRNEKDERLFRNAAFAADCRAFIAAAHGKSNDVHNNKIEKNISHNYDYSIGNMVL